MGAIVGVAVSFREGCIVGSREGRDEGFEGKDDGCLDGWLVGISKGSEEGCTVGLFDGCEDGISTGSREG